MRLLRDIETMDDIKKMVDTFYAKVRKDELIGPIFNDTIQNHWAEHLAKLYTFWQSILFNEQTYTGQAFPPHTQLAIGKEHFDRWLQLFTQTVDRLFAGPVADEAKMRSYRIAEVFQSRLSELH